VPQRANRQFGKLSRFGRVFGVTFVVNGQLLTRVNAVARIGNDFQPHLGGALVFAAAIGQQRKIPARLGAEFCRQPHFQCPRARGVRAIVLPPPQEESR